MDGSDQNVIHSPFSAISFFFLFFFRIGAFRPVPRPLIVHRPGWFYHLDLKSFQSHLCLCFRLGTILDSLLHSC